MASVNNENGLEDVRNADEMEKKEFCVYCNAGPIKVLASGALGSTKQTQNPEHVDGNLDLSEVSSDDMNVTDMSNAELLKTMQAIMTEKMNLQVGEINRNTDEKVDAVMEKVGAIASRVDQIELNIEEAISRITILENSQEDENPEFANR
ncbi:hypothetical protein QAD02_000443 [Eretmocerus hayati]|uniref:Uncharacterized protein n=1 Tax=Eretmocerus hayati TaxID=131215 RepID=A0ACC2NFR9_9HYME|nr:hypothetical protein QAD02_000443 [Eretmocerus hayati]